MFLQRGETKMICRIHKIEIETGQKCPYCEEELADMLASMGEGYEEGVE